MGFFLDRKLLTKVSKTSVQKPGLFEFLEITQDLNKIKKSHTPFCWHWYVENVCEVSAKNI